MRRNANKVRFDGAESYNDRTEHQINYEPKRKVKRARRETPAAAIVTRVVGATAAAAAAAEAAGQGRISSGDTEPHASLCTLFGKSVDGCIPSRLERKCAPQNHTKGFARASKADSTWYVLFDACMV